MTNRSQISTRRPKCNAVSPTMHTQAQITTEAIRSVTFEDKALLFFVFRIFDALRLNNVKNNFQDMEPFL